MRTASRHNLRDSVALLKCEGKVGTAFVASQEGYLLTCLHTLEGNDRSGVIPDSCDITFFNGDGQRNPRKARLVPGAFDKALDVAILRCDDLPSFVRPVLLGHTLEAASAFESAGFPETIIGELKPTPLSGTVTHPFMPYPDSTLEPPQCVVHLHCNQVANDLSPEGWSGGPIVVDGAAFAVVRSFPQLEPYRLEGHLDLDETYDGTPLQGKIRRKGAKGGIVWATLIWQIAARFPDLFYWDRGLWRIGSRPKRPELPEMPHEGRLLVNSVPVSWALPIGQSGYAIAPKREVKDAQAAPLAQLTLALRGASFAVEPIASQGSDRFDLLKLDASPEQLAALAAPLLGTLAAPMPTDVLRHPIDVEVVGHANDLDTWSHARGTILSPTPHGPAVFPNLATLKTGLIFIDDVFVAALADRDIQNVAGMQSRFTSFIDLPTLKDGPDWHAEVLPLHAGSEDGIEGVLAEWIKGYATHQGFGRTVSLNELADLLGLEPEGRSPALLGKRIAATLVHDGLADNAVASCLRRMCVPCESTDATALRRFVNCLYLKDRIAARLRRLLDKKIPRVPAVIYAPRGAKHPSIEPAMHLLTRAQPRGLNIIGPMVGSPDGSLPALLQKIVEFLDDEFQSVRFCAAADADFDAKRRRVQEELEQPNQDFVVILHVQVLRTDVLRALQKIFPSLMLMAVCERPADPLSREQNQGVLLFDFEAELKAALLLPESNPTDRSRGHQIQIG